MRVRVYFALRAKWVLRNSCWYLQGFMSWWFFFKTCTVQLSTINKLRVYVKGETRAVNLHLQTGNYIQQGIEQISHIVLN